MQWAKKQTGFTIVELLIVIIVIAILAAITIVAYSGITKQARGAAAQAAVRQASDKVVLWRLDNGGQYPATLATADVSDTDSTKFQYSVDGTQKSFCITATVGDISYFMSNTERAPTRGGCPGHGQDGIASVTNLVTNPSFETAGATVEVWRNLANNPNAVTTLGFSSNNTTIWTATKETVGASSNPQGILSRAKSVLVSGQTSATIMSMYNIDGLSNTGPARSVGAWMYVTAAGYRATIGPNASGPGVNLSANTWTWVTGDVPTSSWAGAWISKTSGNAGASDIGYITGVTAVVGATPKATIAGGINSLDPDLTASWTGTANASESRLTGQSVPGVSAYNSVVVQSTKWSKYGDKSARIISTAASGSVYVSLSVGANSGNRGTFVLTLHRDDAQPNRSAYNGVAYWNPVPQPMSDKWLASGDHTVRVYGDPHPSGSASSIIVRHDGIAGDPDLYIDGLLRVEGSYQGDYHDGSMANWIWNGTAHASTSTGPGN